tara:strand:- start:66613 stop:67674 length:1062 start_codon:yes stop_codon:yes gene_type:complete
MRTVCIFLALLIAMAISSTISAQESGKNKVETLQDKKDRITEEEKEALKKEIEVINQKLEDGKITAVQAQEMKEAEAKKRALNIENRIAILENKTALLERNGTLDTEDDRSAIVINFRNGDSDEERIFGINFRRRDREPKYDRRTYSDFVIAIGINNALVDGQGLEDLPYKVGGSRFFEMGWAWRTRVFKNSNFLRFNYGFSFQFNGLKPKDDQYFVVNDEQTELQDFPYDLRKAKLRTDNLVFPVHFEFGPSQKRETEHTVRYSLKDQFRIGLGGYGGFNLGTRQKLKYNRDGEDIKEKQKRGFNTTDFVYGLSGYIGFDGVLLYAKYDLNPLFKDALVEQHNVSLGLRFDL